MNPDVLAFAQVAAVIVMLVGSLATIGIVTARSVLGARRRDTVASGSDERLEQLQQSVDAIAIEVERIAEAQRFSARLLAERSEVPSEQR
ncbi:MAG: hypothetical protein ACR2OG_17190 [Gemmatimonadaceae bacterium]